MSILVIQNTNGCDTLANRERRLREISNLGEVTNIDQEILIGDSIISGYTTKNARYGIAVFAPIGDGKYKFQSNTNRENDTLLMETTVIDGIDYNIFWANKPNLDYAEIIYTVDGKTNETIVVDAQDNKMIYTKAPSKNYNVQYIFVDQDGIRYE